MNILFLGPNKTPQNTIKNFLLNDDNFVQNYDSKLDLEFIEKCKYDYLISFGYRHIIQDDIINYFEVNAINLHISYLPWNRGSDPNLWSFLENTPKGVTIHQIDYNIDTGKILCQKEVFFHDNDTLASSYYKLQNELVELFKINWEKIKDNKLKPYTKKMKGSYHKSSDKNIYKDLLINGWETKVKDLTSKVVQHSENTGLENNTN